MGREHRSELGGRAAGPQGNRTRRSPAASAWAPQPPGRPRAGVGPRDLRRPGTVTPGKFARAQPSAPRRGARPPPARPPLPDRGRLPGSRSRRAPERPAGPWGLASALPGVLGCSGPCPEPDAGTRKGPAPSRGARPKTASAARAPRAGAPPHRPPRPPLRPQPGPGPPRSAPAARGRARAPSRRPGAAHARRRPPARQRRPHSPRAGPVSAGGAAVSTALRPGRGQLLRPRPGLSGMRRPAGSAGTRTQGTLRGAARAPELGGRGRGVRAPERRGRGRAVCAPGGAAGHRACALPCLPLPWRRRALTLHQ